MHKNVFIAELGCGIAWAVFTDYGMNGATLWDVVIEDFETGEVRCVGYTRCTRDGLWEGRHDGRFYLTDNLELVLDDITGGGCW